MTAAGPGALDGLLVADFSTVLAGPYLTMLLADLGATVVKVEGPRGDAPRRWGPPWHDGTSTYYMAVNRNKRSVALDLAAEGDRGLALELARRADLLVQNLLPGRMARWGLGWEQLEPINPGLVYCSISGFGSQPAGASLAGYDLLAQALSGLMSITGPIAGPPTKVGVALVDVLCGLHGATAVLAALQARGRSGRGQHVEVNLLSSALSGLANQAAGYLLAGAVPTAIGNGHPSVAPYETYATADGEIVVAVGEDRQFQSLCDAIERPSWREDPRFITNQARVENRAALNELIAGELAPMRSTAAVERLRAFGVPSGPVQNIAEAFAFADEIGLEPTWKVDDDSHVRAPFRLGATPPTMRGRPPAYDQDGKQIRAWLRSDAHSSVREIPLRGFEPRFPP